MSSKATLSAIKTIESQIESLAARHGDKTAVPTLQMHVGEDERTVLDAWRRECPTSAVPDRIIIGKVFGALPRPQYATKDSLAEVLPQLKHFNEQ